MLEAYIKCVRELLDKGLRPVVRPFKGTLWHGTGQSAVESVVKTGVWKPDPYWNTTWIGPAFYGFMDRCPAPGLDPSIPILREAGDFGRWAASLVGALQVRLRRVVPPPAIIEASINCTRVLDLESMENDRFIVELKKRISAVSPPTQKMWEDSIKPAFPAKVLHFAESYLDEAIRPQAYATDFMVDETGELQRGLAVVDLTAICSFKNG